MLVIWSVWFIVLPYVKFCCTFKWCLDDTVSTCDPWNMTCILWGFYILVFNMFINVCVCVFDQQELEDLDRWGFNIFRVAEFSNNRPLSCVMYAIFQVKKMSVNVCFLWDRSHLKCLWVYMASSCSSVCVCVLSSGSSPSSSGARAVEDVSYPSWHLCHLCDDPGGPLPWKRSVPQQPPCCRCHPVHTRPPLHTCSWCMLTYTLKHTNTHTHTGWFVLPDLASLPARVIFLFGWQK